MITPAQIERLKKHAARLKTQWVIKTARDWLSLVSSQGRSTSYVSDAKLFTSRAAAEKFVGAKKIEAPVLYVPAADVVGYTYGMSYKGAIQVRLVPKSLAESLSSVLRDAARDMERDNKDALREIKALDKRIALVKIEIAVHSKRAKALRKAAELAR